MAATRSNLLISLIHELDRYDGRIAGMTSTMDRQVAATKERIDARAFILRGRVSVHDHYEPPAKA